MILTFSNQYEVGEVKCSWSQLEADNGIPAARQLNCFLHPFIPNATLSPARLSAGALQLHQSAN